MVSDFRSRDIAAGGQGAPLVPLVDVLLFGRTEGPRVLMNIGGIANVTYVPGRGEREGAIAFDTGPGVSVIDAVVRLNFPDRQFDEDGRYAADGQVPEGQVERVHHAIPARLQSPGAKPSCRLASAAADFWTLRRTLLADDHPRQFPA